MIYIYTRVSTQGQAEKGDSIKGQIAKCQAWATIEDVEGEITVIEELAVSGGVPLRERPQGKILFNQIKAGDIVICYRLDRLFRNALDALQTTEEFAGLGVGLVLLNISHKNIIEDSVGKLILSILSAVAEMEKETIRGRMMDGKESKRARGFWCGGRPPFGKRIAKTPEGSRLVDCPMQKPVLTDIINMHRKGYSYRKIEQQLKDEGHNLTFASVGRIVRENMEMEA
jgi:putative DNA-invertase from lambdoid prophage Rac